ncbi:hypothetical protein L6452_05798 [Arctium lappa]|uniref:Uncharacterized protein n=1 Tax=Arctium lappa TaxID=4217 RepID=A0ACB9EGY8_ARCLA|nr:hypothetical protein L6452_05798 [Arctium lappa]
MSGRLELRALSSVLQSDDSSSLSRFINLLHRYHSSGSSLFVFQSLFDFLTLHRFTDDSSLSIHHLGFTLLPSLSRFLPSLIQLITRFR